MMLMSAYVELTMAQSARDLFAHLGYPMYLLTILGVAKVLGVIGIWQTKVTFLKEWAYAGFMIDFTGALASHLIVADRPQTYFPAVVALVLVVTSYVTFRKLNSVNSTLAQNQ